MVVAGIFIVFSVRGQRTETSLAQPQQKSP